ncbi:hypothetical protein [Dactylosporangium sp. NPDC048998]|uniref:hypothetical protein n=1 Tax=Dactylosporangium sp. NPDC048998 TaxID=3363976 RepID=UPI0037147584
MRLEDLAHRLDSAGDELAGASTTLSLVDPGARALGADGAGGLARAGRDLHRLLATALTARGTEAAAHGARLAETAHALRQVAAGYRGAEEDSRVVP